MNAIVREGVVAALVLLTGCSEVKGSFKTRTITDRSDMKVSATSNDASVRLHLLYTFPVWNPVTQKYELRTMTCADAPPDALVLLGGNGNGDVGAEKKKASPVITAAAAFAFSSSGAQLQRAANQRRTDSIHEAMCSMYVAGAISGREYLAQEVMNAKVALVMAGEEAIVSLLAPPPPAMTISVNAPASPGSAPQPAGIGIDPASDDGSSGGSTGTGTSNSNSPPSAGTVAAPATPALSDCQAKPAKQRAACLKSATANQKSPKPDKSGTGAVTRDPETVKTAIAAIVQLTEDGLALKYSDMSCFLDASHASLSEEQWRVECGANDDAVAVEPNDAQPLTSEFLIATFSGKRLYTQVESPTQVNDGRALVQALGTKFGKYMGVFTVQVSPQKLPNVVIRYYGRTKKEDSTDPDYIAASELGRELENAGVFSPKEVTVANWTCCVAKVPNPGLLELWIPANVTIHPAAFAQPPKTPASATPAKSKKTRRASPSP